jgi:hypothetical protein
MNGITKKIKPESVVRRKPLITKLKKKIAKASKKALSIVPKR